MTKHLGWIALLVLAVAPYAGALHAPLLYDDRTLLDNAWLSHEAGALSVFRHDYWHGTKHAGSDLYRPLTILSLAWNVQAAPTKEGIRSVNVAAHAAATLALFFLLTAFTSSRAAWIGAALFAVHPLASEAVLWAVGRAEIFAALSGFVAFALFVRLTREDAPGGVRLALSVAAFFAALCFKESAAAWLVIGAIWVALSRAKVPWVRAAGYLSAFAAYVALRASVVGFARKDIPFVDNPLAVAGTATRMANAVLLFARYLGKMLWPGSLSIEYGFDQIPVTPAVPWGAAAALSIAALVVLFCVVLRRKGHTAAALLVAWVPAAFAVTGNLAFPIGTIFAERLAYLPLAGFCGLAGLAVAAIPGASLRAAAVAAGLVLCAGRTIARGGDYRDVATLSEATAAASPRAVKALVNAARGRLRQHDAARALPLLEKAVAIWPDYARAWELLAEAYAATGQPARAEEAIRRASEAKLRASSADDSL